MDKAAACADPDTALPVVRADSRGGLEPVDSVRESLGEALEPSCPPRLIEPHVPARELRDRLIGTMGTAA